jgi:hypothetical protein
MLRGGGQMECVCGLEFMRSSNERCPIIDGRCQWQDVNIRKGKKAVVLGEQHGVARFKWGPPGIRGATGR